MKLSTSYVSIILIGLFSLNLNGQTQDSLAQKPVTKDKPYGVFSMFKGNPGKAGLFSLLLPGAGQLYNRKYWKIPLFVGAEVGTIAILLNSIDTYKYWDDGYKIMAADNGINDFEGLTNISSVKSIRDNKRQSKDYAWIAVIAVHFITAADAFVDRHLIEFNVDDDIEVGLSPMAPYPGLSLVVDF